MPKGFLDILEIARENIRKNPSLAGRPAEDIARQYLKGLSEEVEEVTAEVRPKNKVHLEDELSDIAWDYACVLVQLEMCGYIDNAEAVLTHGFTKYSERRPAFLESGEEAWESVKGVQKQALKKRHEDTYGN